MEIVDIGDPLAYHTNISLNSPPNGGPGSSVRGDVERYVGEAELPAEVVRQLEEILDRFDWDEL